MNMNSKLFVLVSGALVVAALSGCGNYPQSSRGFRLPDGNAEKGQQAFLALQCNQCHQVDGVDFPAPKKFNLLLGGDTARLKTYGELVTSIINPSHVLSDKYQQQLTDSKESPMPKFNAEMTVEQLVDLVAFLQPRYKIVVPDYNPYPYYP